MTAQRDRITYATVGLLLFIITHFHSFIFRKLYGKLRLSQVEK